MDETAAATNPDAPANDTQAAASATKPTRLDALTPEDAEILKSMSAEAQAAIMAAMGAGGLASGEGSGPAEEAAEEVAEEMEGTTMDKLLAAIETLTTRVAALEGGTVDASAAPPAGADKPAGKPKTDGAPGKPGKVAPIQGFDPDAVIRAAREAAAVTARETFDASGKFVAAVRCDGHHDVATVADAAKVMLVTIGKHLPLLKADAEAHLKAGRMDSLTNVYKQAEAVRRDSLLETQGRAVMDALSSGLQGDATGADGAAAGNTVPFRLPAPRGA